MQAKTLSPSRSWIASAYLLLLLASTAGAAEFFVCDCAAGADPDCVAGGDGLSGTDAAHPWRTYEKARAAFGALAAGDAIRLCDGGVFPIGAAASSRWSNANCTAAQPCTVSNYSPPWAGGDELRPRIESNGTHAFDLANGGSARHEEGYLFANLQLACVNCEATSGWGFFLYNDIDDVVIDGVDIDGFDIGVHIGGSNSCAADPLCDGRNDRLVLRRSRIVNSWSQGFLGGGNGVRVEDNDFENNGSVALFDHNIYYSGYTAGSRIAGNRLYHSVVRANGRCAGTSLVVHGVHDDLRIEGNLVREDLGAVDQGCWGIAVDTGYSTSEGFTNIVIAGNEVRNVGNVAIGVNACADCVIENNLIVNEHGFAATAIAAPDRAGGSGDLGMTRVTVRNNSISLGGAGTGIALGGEGTGHVLVSNAILATGATPSWACLDVDLPSSAYTAIDHNVCGHTAGEWARGYGDLVTWQGNGRDLASANADPGFTDPLDLRPANVSAAIVDRGHPSASATLDRDGVLRDAQPDVGAYEFPAPPTDPNECPPAPLSTCALADSPNGSALGLKTDAQPRRDAITWAWRGDGAATGFAFDAATAAEGYRFCVWDHDAGSPRLVVGVRLSPGAAWERSHRDHRLRVHDPALGRIRVSLRGAGDHRLRFSATGLLAADPILPAQASLPLVTQWIADGGACWGAEFAGARTTGARLRARNGG